MRSVGKLQQITVLPRGNLRDTPDIEARPCTPEVRVEEVARRPLAVRFPFFKTG